YIEVWHYPDGRKELRLNEVVLPYSTYDRLQKIDQGAIVDNKRLGRTLEFIKQVQDKRDNNRSQALPAGDGPSRRRRKPTEKKSQRSLDEDDMLNALKTLQSRSDEKMARRDEIVVATKTFFPWRNSPNTGFLSRKAIFQSIDDSLMRLGMDYVDLFQIHRFDYSTPVEETMEALHDVVKAGKARYIGASSMEAWRFAKMQHTAERNGWTRFITMQPQYNLLYREEEREMLPLCEDQGVGVIPWSPMARGRLTRDWSVTSRRTQNDAFALKMYETAALLDKPVIDVVASIAEKHAVPRAHVAIAWLLSKSVITAPIIGATKPEHLSTAISALDFSLSDAEITELEARYLPHPVDGIIPPLPDTPPSLTPPSAIQNY
ncbi:aldo/keto reductase, partial [Klebsiella pneumoniae]|nr:aldo/keto reductase [Klebsiella pneumoniae]